MADTRGDGETKKGTPRTTENKMTKQTELEGLIGEGNPIPPTREEWFQDGVLSLQVWKIDGSEDGELHRVGGPAYASWNPNGTLHEVEWHLNGKQHRTDGPAGVVYNADGTVKFQERWIDGERVWDR